MAQQTALDTRKSALLVMDFINMIVEGYASDPKGVVERAAQAIQGARRAGMPVIYINPGAADPKANPGAAMPAALAPSEGERVLGKSRIGSFSGTDLDTMLKAEGRDTLVLMGVATSGCVLSTARHGYELGYQIVVVSDACSDPEPEIHHALTDSQTHTESWIGLWRLGSIITTQELLASLS